MDFIWNRITDWLKEILVGGILRIEFYHEEAIERSTKILCEKGYSLHNRK